MNLGSASAGGVDLERAYNNRANVPEHVEIQVARDKASKAYRATSVCELDISYGTDERNLYDFFPASAAPATGKAPLAIYIHGGYWMRGDRRNQSHFARGLNTHGIALAMPSYRLCPAVNVMDVVGDLRAFMAALWARFGQKIFVVGHSAGGHLTSAMVATDWAAQDGNLPPDLVSGAFALSGVYDLTPLVGLEVTEPIQLTADVAEAASTITWQLPRTDVPMAAAVGLSETPVFIDQTRRMCKDWTGKGLNVELIEVPGANHFTVVEPLSDPDSAMTTKIAEMVKSGVS